MGTTRLGGSVQPGESHRRNYYNNDKYAADLRRASDVVAQRVKDRDLARPAEAWSFEVAAAEDPSRRKNLTGKLFPIGAGSPNGFIDARRRWKYPQSHPPGEKNGNGSGNRRERAADNAAQPPGPGGGGRAIQLVPGFPCEPPSPFRPGLADYRAIGLWPDGPCPGA